MTTATDRTSAVTDMRRAFEHTRALLSSLRPIAEEDEDTLTGEEDTAPDQGTSPTYRPSPQTRTHTQEK